MTCAGSPLLRPVSTPLPTSWPLALAALALVSATVALASELRSERLAAAAVASTTQQASAIVPGLPGPTAAPPVAPLPAKWRGTPRGGDASGRIEPRPGLLSSWPQWVLSTGALLALGGLARWLRPHQSKSAVDTMSMLTLSAGPSTPANGSTFTTASKARVKQPVFTEKCERVGITLTRFINEMVRANPEMAEIDAVFASIQTAGKAITKLVQRAPMDGTLGRQGASNVHGEEQKKLDVITNDLLKRVLKYTGRMGVIASEEEDEPVPVHNKAPASYELADDEDEGRYVTVFDPLDGSSNVDAAIPVGTIFGIFEREEGCHLPENYFPSDSTAVANDPQCLRRTLRAGKSLVAAGYLLYSSSTYFVFTVGAGVHGFVLDHSLGEFILTHPRIEVPARGGIFSINSANRRTWDKPMQVFIDSLADGTNSAGREYTSRYIGCMVGDVHRTLMYGGVFAYPSDSKNVSGKLRLLYEAAPMSFIIEQAGGKSSTGVVRIMDIPPKSVHQRVPCVMGGREEVEECEAWYRRLAGAKLLAAHEALLAAEDPFALP